MKTLDQQALFRKANSIAKRYFKNVEQLDLFSHECEELFEEFVSDEESQVCTSILIEPEPLNSKNQPTYDLQKQDNILVPIHQTESSFTIESESESNSEFETEPNTETETGFNSESESNIEFKTETESDFSFALDVLDEYVEVDLVSEEDESDYVDDYVKEPDKKTSESKDSSLTSEKLTPLENASQQASIFRTKHNWSIDSQDALTHLFNTRGWGRIKSALKFLIKQEDMKESEFLVAKQIRQYWKDNTQYWIFIPSYSAPLSEAKANYSTLAWRWCLKALRSFSQSQASVAEITQTISEHYEDWYQDDDLPAAFPAFQHYICYLIDSSNLQKRLSFYNSAHDADYYKLDGFWVDSGCQDPLGLTEITMLQELGILD